MRQAHFVVSENFRNISWKRLTSYLTSDLVGVTCRLKKNFD